MKQFKIGDVVKYNHSGSREHIITRIILDPNGYKYELEDSITGEISLAGSNEITMNNI